MQQPRGGGPGGKSRAQKFRVSFAVVGGGQAGRGGGVSTCVACLPSFLHARSGQGQARQTEAGRKERREEGRGERREERPSSSVTSQPWWPVAMILGWAALPARPLRPHMRGRALSRCHVFAP